MAALAELVKTPVLGQEGPAGAAIPPRHDAGEAFRLHSSGRTPSCGAIPPSDTSLPARYARAIAAYRFGDLRAALAQIDGLIQAMPNNPYFYELKGQALLEGGHPAEAIAPLRRAVATCAQPGADPDPAGAGADRHQQHQERRDEAIPLLRAAMPRSRNPATPMSSSPWPTAARAISPTPILPRRRPPSRAATTRPRANLPRAPRSVSRSVRPAG